MKPVLVVGRRESCDVVLRFTNVSGQHRLVILGRPTIAGALYGVSSGDPVAWLAAAAVLLFASALANLVPAWRAVRVDPCVALRTE